MWPDHPDCHKTFIIWASLMCATEAFSPVYRENCREPHQPIQHHATTTEPFSNITHTGHFGSSNCHCRGRMWPKNPCWECHRHLHRTSWTVIPPRDLRGTMLWEHVPALPPPQRHRLQRPSAANLFCHERLRPRVRCVAFCLQPNQYMHCGFLHA